jgi:glycosyltransferase involved in cell wall biosynthesis
MRRDTTNGVDRVVSLLARQQRALGCEVTLLRFARADPATSVDPETGIETRVLTRSGPRLTGEALAIFERNSLGADLAHFHSAFIPAHNLAARRIAMPYVVSPHSAYQGNALRRSRWRKLAYRYLLDLPYVRRAGFLHAITEEEKASIANYGAPRRIELVPNPVEGVAPIGLAERQAARSSLGLEKGDLCVVFIGRLDVRHKGLDLLIEGLRLARVAAPVKLILAGPVDPRPDVRSLLREADAASVFVMPPVFGEAKRRLLVAGDVFATPSRWDVLPGATLEALSHGMPVLVTEATGFRPFLTAASAGAVVAPDASAIGEALLRFAASPPDAAERAGIAAATAEAFAPLRIAERFIAEYRTVVAA